MAENKRLTGKEGRRAWESKKSPERICQEDL